MPFIAPTAAASPVVLGSKKFYAPQGKGWGKAHPSEIFNGGDPSGLVTHIHWSNWGSSSARGRGLTSIFKPGGGYYDQLVPIKLRAHALGRCSRGGPRAYTALEFRVPQRPGGAYGKWQLWSGQKSICRVAL